MSYIHIWTFLSFLFIFRYINIYVSTSNPPAAYHIYLPANILQSHSPTVSVTASEFWSVRQRTPRVRIIIVLATREGQKGGWWNRLQLCSADPGGRLRVNLSSRAADADDVYDSSTCNLFYIIYFIRTRIRRMHTRNTVMIARCVFRKRFEFGEKKRNKKQINKRRGPHCRAARAPY